MNAESLTTAEQTARLMRRRALGLALIAGYVDAFTLFHFGVFTSFMSGNTTHAGLDTGLGRLGDALPHLLVVPLFVSGACVGTLIRGFAGHAFRWLCVLVATLLTVGLATVSVGSSPDWLKIIPFGFAMGVLNSSITRVGGQPVGVGFVTGDMNKLGAQLALAIQRAPVSDSQGPWDTHLWRAALLTSIWVSLLLGAVLAGVTMERFGTWVLFAPILILLGMAVLAATSDGSPTARDANGD